MKRNNLILGFVICALLLVGIGFALTSTPLVLSGKLKSQPSARDFDVVLVEGDYYTIETTSNGHQATFDVDEIANLLGKAGDSVEITIQVQNMSEVFDAKVERRNIKVTNSNSENFDVQVVTEYLYLCFQETGEITVRITLLKSVVETLTSDITVTITPEAVNAAT